ncbi:MAG: hypothetical protein ACLFVJ_07115 [Persicimonas sp.]
MISTRYYNTLTAAVFVCGLIVLGATGCFEASCTEIGCEGNLQCNEETGQCEEAVRSCEPGDCPSGKVCEPSSGTCRSEGARCVDNSCPARQVCNAQTGFCEAQANCQVDSCHSSAEQCDPLSGECVPKDCEADSECGAGFYCSTDDQCRAGCRIGEQTSCPPGQFCRGSLDEVVGQCREECQADEQCPIGQICEQSQSGSSCEPEPACDTDDDCRDVGVCQESTCQPPPCASDDDCPGDEACERATGQCIGGSCEEDIHAPNQTLDQAAQLAPGRHSGLRLCVGKSDWFTIPLRSSDALRLRLEHTSSADLDIFVFDEHGELLAANQQTGSVTVLEMISERTQTAAIQITSSSTDDELYDLEITRNSDGAFCRDDTSEENDRPSEAVALPTDPGASFEISLAICGADEDWFMLPDLAATSGLSVARTDADDHITLELFAPDGQSFELGEHSWDDDEIQLDRLGAAGDHLVRVRSRFARSDTYRLRTRVLDPLVCEDARAHETADQALQIPSNSVRSLPFCPLEDAWEVDWLALDQPDEDTLLTAQVVPVGDLPSLDVVLFEQTDEGPERIRRAAFTDDTYRLRVPADDGADYLLRLSADGAPGRIIDGVDYQVFYRYEPLD